MTEQFSNFAQSSLASAITAIQTTISVANSISFPLLGNFRIVVQSFDVTTQIPTSAPEIMIVTAVNGKQFTVTRGAENTTAIAFASGAQVSHIVTAGVMQALQSGNGVSSLNSLTGALNIVAGSNITVTPSGNNITIASTGGGGGSPGGTNGELQYNNAGSFGGDTATTDGAGNITANSLTAGALISPTIQITTSPTSGYVLTSDSSGKGTWQAGGSVSSANPTATAGPTVINGTATTFMRSDASPAVQTATTGQLGLVQPDGTSITISAGVISASGGGGGITMAQAQGIGLMRL